MRRVLPSLMGPGDKKLHYVLEFQGSVLTGMLDRMVIHSDEVIKEAGLRATVHCSTCL